MRLVVLESPYRGDVEKNLEYARKCLRDSLDRNESPIASHMLHTQVLDDRLHEDRQLGIMAGHSWIRRADAVVVYCDLGISYGMQSGIDHARLHQVLVEYRHIEKQDKELELPPFDDTKPMISLAFMPYRTFFEPAPEDYPGWELSFHVCHEPYRDQSRNYQVKAPAPVNRLEALRFFRQFDRARFEKNSPGREWYDSYYELASSNREELATTWFYSVVTPFTD